MFSFLSPLLLVAQTVVVHANKAELPPQDEIWYSAVTQTSESEWKYLKGASRLQTSEMSITADEIDFNSDTSWAFARGHVHMDHYATGDKLNADHAEYNIRTEEGKFYAMNGTSPSKILTSPGVLTTTNPFYFQAAWADRIQNRYILHHGFITDCKIPKPWWTFQAPQFDIVPGERAIARHAVLRVHHIPVLYLPYFYRPLGRNPRQSGFLTPNIGNSSIRGYMIGGGYYWAISRSYDADYVLQYFTVRGPSHTFNIRGKPNDVSDFSFNYYAVQDKGIPQVCLPTAKVCPPPIKEGGQEFNLTGRTQIWGFTGRLDFNYLSSYLFRQAFANSFNTALSSQVKSIGFLQRHFDHDLYSLDLVLSRDQLFEAVTFLNQPTDDVIIEKLPAVELYGRPKQITKSLPLWFSFSGTAGLERREESDYVANQGSSVFRLDTGATPRIDVEPRVATAFRFDGFTLEPSVTFGATDYGKNYSSNSTSYVAVSCGGYPSCAPGVSAYNVSVKAANLLRKDADFQVSLHTPSIERIFTPPPFLHMGAKLKHVVELDATYEYLTGIDQFQRIIHFDQTDIVSNTNQLTFNLTNRLYKKDKAGLVTEFLTWHLTQARYFDPTFGGAVVVGQRNVVLAALELSPYTFLDGPRSYSPIQSALLMNPYPFLALEYRSAYDPARHRFINHGLSSTFHVSKYSVSIVDTAITTIPLLVPQANQIGFGAAYGSSTRRGWNLGGNVTYDLLLDRQLFQFVQGTYNTDCCGFSFQLRRYNFGIRDENQYLFSFSLANLGTFGSMQKQDRIF